MKNYKLLPGAGGHRIGTGEQAFTVREDVFIKSDHPLDIMFVNKFVEVDNIPDDSEVVTDATVKSTAPVKELKEPVKDLKASPSKLVDKKETTKTKSKKEGKEEDFGKDISDKFPLAEEKDVKVYFKDDKYRVVDSKGKELESKKVKGNITKFLKTL